MKIERFNISATSQRMGYPPKRPNLFLIWPYPKSNKSFFLKHPTLCCLKKIYVKVYYAFCILWRLYSNIWIFKSKIEMRISQQVRSYFSDKLHLLHELRDTSLLYSLFALQLALKFVINISCFDDETRGCTCHFLEILSTNE